MCRLDRFWDDNGLGPIDLLKIDVEGFERKVVQGAKSLIKAGMIKALLCEISEFWLQRTGSSVCQFHGELLDLGFVPVEPNVRSDNVFFLYDPRPNTVNTKVTGMARSESA